MIYLTGDLHGDVDGKRLSIDQFDYSGLTKEDYLIVCGDFGYVWNGNEKDDEKLDWLESLPMTILFIDGNHENFTRLYQYPEQTWHGGKIHVIRDHVYHLMRGFVFEIEGKTFFTFGGGKSVDKQRRVEGISWWQEEIPSSAEFQQGLHTLEEVNWKVDYVLTHTAPSGVIGKIAPYIGKDILNDYLEVIDEQLTYKHWYFGHYHVEKDLDDKHTLFYYFFLQPGETLTSHLPTRAIIK